MRLTKEQIESLKTIVNKGITKGFYLAGGTAITIKYSHRFSDDFDFFLFPDDNRELFHLLNNFKPDKIIGLDNSTLIFIINNVKFSFFKYPYKLLKSPIYNEKLNIHIASDDDLIAMKSIAIIQRGEKKDFFDLWFLMNQNNLNLEKIIKLNLDKYETVFNPSLFFKAIIFFDDAEQQRIDSIEPQWGKIKSFFRKEVNRYIKN